MTQRITEFLRSFKASVEAGGLPLYDLLLALLLIGIGFGGFALGRLSAGSARDSGVRICAIEESILTEGRQEGPKTSMPGAPSQRTAPAPRVPQAQTASAEEAVPIGEEGAYVASKSGKAYHLPWCPGAGRIKEENKIWFKSKEEAEAAGYSPAGNCKGL